MEIESACDGERRRRRPRGDFRQTRLRHRRAPPFAEGGFVLSPILTFPPGGFALRVYLPARLKQGKPVGAADLFRLKFEERIFAGLGRRGNRKRYEKTDCFDYFRWIWSGAGGRIQRHCFGQNACDGQADAAMLLAAHPLLGPGRGPARRTDGQQRGGAYQHRRRPGCLPGADPHHQVHPGRGFL